MAEEAEVPPIAANEEEDAAMGEEAAPEAEGDDEEDGDVPEPAEGDEGEEEDEDDEEEAAEGAAAGSSAAKKKGPPVKKSGDRKRPVTTQTKAGVVFPVGRIRKALQRGAYSKSVRMEGAIYLTSVIEYVVAEILELAGNSAKEQKKNRIVPRHILLAVRSDEELNKYLSNVTITGGGVLPNIHQVLLPGKPKESAAAADKD